MRTAKRSIAVAAFVAFCLVLMLVASTVQAHARLVAADPAANATVPPPKVIWLRFSEQIARKFSGFKLVAADGKAVVLTPLDIKEGKLLAAAPPAPLAPGPYTLSWTAVANDDGHRTSGAFKFTVK